jgi:hypothetical protein
MVTQKKKCNTNKNVIKMGVIIKKLTFNLFSSQCQLTSIALMPPPQFPPPFSPMITTFPDFSPGNHEERKCTYIYPKPLFLVQGSNIWQAGFDTTLPCYGPMKSRMKNDHCTKSKPYGFYRTKWQTFCSSVFMTAVICPMAWTPIISAATPLLPPTNRSCL